MMSSESNLKQVTYTGLAVSALALAIASYALYKIKPLAAGDDQPITVAGGSVQLQTDNSNAGPPNGGDPWYEYNVSGKQILAYNRLPAYQSAYTNVGQIEIKGKNSAGTDFSYRAYRDPTKNLEIEIEFSKTRGVDPITRVLLESQQNQSSTKSDDVWVTVISTNANRHEFKYKKKGLREFDEPGWKIQKVILRSGLIVVPGTTPLPTEIAVTHQDFYMRLHDCPLDSTHTDGRCRP